MTRTPENLMKEIGKLMNEGLTLEQIAARLNISVDTINWLLERHRAIECHPC
jgi:orotate phosphoribosyltransferase-like protein